MKEGDEKIPGKSKVDSLGRLEKGVARYTPCHVEFRATEKLSLSLEKQQQWKEAQAETILYSQQSKVFGQVAKIRTGRPS